MSSLIWIAIGLMFISLLPVLINLYASYLLSQKNDQPAPLPRHWPRVAILVAARNEAHNLPRCLQALEKLDYPADKLSIWIGNDQSTDQTLELAGQWCRVQENRQLIDIKENWGNARGKANVLAQLARHAAHCADYYFITDADVAVNPAWIRFMLPHFSEGTGIVNGTTLVEEATTDSGSGKDKTARMQRYDWLLALGLVKAFAYLSRKGETLFAIGNNMALRRDAYEAVGGYETIPFSVTEDFELHRQLKRIGYSSKHLVCREAKALTLPAMGSKELLHQRKRWMRGAMQLPWPMVLILFLQALFFPAILVVLFYAPFLGLGLLTAKLFSQALLIRIMLHRLSEPATFPFAGYELYSMLLNMSLIVFYYLPVPLQWKGRRYK